jgi:hypothetical protein
MSVIELTTVAASWCCRAVGAVRGLPTGAAFDLSPRMGKRRS